MAATEKPSLEAIKPMLVSLVKEAQGVRGGDVALAAAMVGQFVRREFEAERVLRFGPGASGGVAFSDAMTDMMLLDPEFAIWQTVSRGRDYGFDIARIADMRGEAGSAAAFPILPVEGISLSYDWISYRALKLGFEVDAFARTIKAQPMHMACMFAAIVSALIATDGGRKDRALTLLALDVMIAFARVPRKTRWNMAPPAKQAPPQRQMISDASFG